jgi:Flp pilus assembly pilin Flp
VRRLLIAEHGPTAVEDAVMVGLIVVAMIVLVRSMSQRVSGSCPRPAAR